MAFFYTYLLSKTDHKLDVALRAHSRLRLLDNFFVVAEKFNFFGPVEKLEDVVLLLELVAIEFECP